MSRFPDPVRNVPLEGYLHNAGGSGRPGEAMTAESDRAEAKALKPAGAGFHQCLARMPAGRQGPVGDASSASAPPSLDRRSRVGAERPYARLFLRRVIREGSGRCLLDAKCTALRTWSRSAARRRSVGAKRRTLTPSRGVGHCAWDADRTPVSAMNFDEPEATGADSCHRRVVEVRNRELRRRPWK
jgi:hypothetical protein